MKKRTKQEMKEYMRQYRLKKSVTPNPVTPKDVTPQTVTPVTPKPVKDKTDYIYHHPEKKWVKVDVTPKEALPSLNKKEAKAAILKLLNKRGEVDFDVIVSELGLYLPMVVEICEELEKENKMTSDFSPQIGKPQKPLKSVTTTNVKDDVFVNDDMKQPLTRPDNFKPFPAKLSKEHMAR